MNELLLRATYLSVKMETSRNELLFRCEKGQEEISGREMLTPWLPSQDKYLCGTPVSHLKSRGENVAQKVTQNFATKLWRSRTEINVLRRDPHFHFLRKQGR